MKITEVSDKDKIKVYNLRAQLGMEEEKKISVCNILAIYIQWLLNNDDNNKHWKYILMGQRDSSEFKCSCGH